MKRRYDRYRVNPNAVDAFDIDPRVIQIIEETEARNGTVREAFDVLVSEGFEPEACKWILKLYAAVGGIVGNA